jgi:hypothetical protein
MPSSRMLRPVALVRTDVSEERIASIIRMTIIDELGTTLAVTSNRSILQINALQETRVWASTVCYGIASVFIRR